MEIIESYDQWVHLKVRWRNNESWLITTVYRSLWYAGRQQLWKDLQRLGLTIAEPWLVLEDFNVVVNNWERRGGANFQNERGVQGF